MKAFEVNFDGLVGPTHNYAGLSFGNIASEQNEHAVSNPKQAAKQGLLKMKALSDMGIKQGMLPPHQRPDLLLLRQVGFSGTDAQVIDKVAKREPILLAAAYSASSMWLANAATVSPSADTLDAKVHFTAANLNSTLHRSLEHPTTSRLLQAIFSDPQHFVHHKALPNTPYFGDEGAANHTRFCSDYGEQGVELFVYGRSETNKYSPRPNKYPARQTLEASKAISRLHGLDEARVVYAQQQPDTIDAGVFHNDVIAVGNRNLLFYHEVAFVDSKKVVDEINRKLPDTELNSICVTQDEVSLSDAVQSYLFNSQLISLTNGKMMLVVPQECRQIRSVSDYLDELLRSHPMIERIESFDLKQSMKNGGGPACLRLRVVLTEQELHAIDSRIFMGDVLFNQLNAWVDKHYRDNLSPNDLRDVRLIDEVQSALAELNDILGLSYLA